MNAASQWATIGWMVLSGALMGIGFDVYRVASHRFRVPSWLLPALDLAFWAAATLGVFSILLDSNRGEVRMYVFLGLGIGVTGYFGLLSRQIVRATAWTIDALAKLAAWLWRLFRLLLVVPVAAIVRALARLLDIVFVVITAILLWLARLLAIPLRRPARWAWAKLAPVRRRVHAGVQAWRKLRDRIKAAWSTFRRKP